MTTMNANELRLGNWVHPVFPMKVVSIYADEILCNFQGNEGDVWEYNPKDLDGIPLTNEWLMRFGFDLSKGSITWAVIEEIDEVNSNQYQTYKIEIGITDFKFVYINDRCICKIDYVHQLQNLYHALTGKEL